MTTDVNGEKRVNVQPKMIYFYFTMNSFELPHGNIGKVACASGEDLDQPGHPPSLSDQNLCNILYR